MTLRRVGELPADAGGAHEGRPGIEKLLRTVDALHGARCTGCGEAICGHEAVMCVAMGFETSPRCARCFAAAIGAGEDPAFAGRLRERIGRRRCWLSGWERATSREGGCTRGLAGSAEVASAVATPR